MLLKLRRKSKIKDNSSFAVDRSEGNCAVLQNLETKDIIEVELGFPVSDGDIIVFKDNSFMKDEKKEEARRREILEKFEKVKRRSE